ncbi:MAG: zinc-ribbon domain-containing protein [Clostridiales bacterium]|nr:zinc-ribbon domain-containing protein [Clostridiales bacterium]
MKCTNCNAENSSDALFCSECGTKFASPVPEQIPAPEDLAETPSEAPVSEEIEAPTEAIDASVEAASELNDSSLEDFEVPEDAPSPFAPTASVFSEDTQSLSPTVPAFGSQESTPPVAPTVPTPDFQQQVPQPAFAPVPQPMAPAPQPMAPVAPAIPVAPENKKNKAPGEKGGKKFFVPMIIFIILFALAAAGLGVGAYLYMKQKSDLNTEIEDRDKTIDDKDGEIADLEEQVTDLSDKEEALKKDKTDLEQNVNQLQENVNSLTNDLTTAKKERDDYKAQIEANENDVKGIYSSIKNLVPPTTSYFASKNVLVLSPGESETIMVSLRATGVFSVSYRADNKNTTGQWSDQWVHDGSLNSCPLTFTAGSQPGKTLFTFTNDKSSESFQILVIVVG